jgi:hypothetical protein
MGMFPVPLVANDGTDDHNYYYRGQVNDPRSKVGEWIETAAEIAAEPLVVVKHDLRSSVPRHLVSSKINVEPAANADGVLLPITINTTITANKAFSVAELELEFTKHLDVLGTTDLIKSLRSAMLG